MSDNFISLYNRLLNRAPNVGVVLAQQFVNDAWRTLQARNEWSFRRRSITIAPPALYSTGAVWTNVFNGNPTLISGVGTNWDPTMVGRQIRIGGLPYPYYTILAVLDPQNLLIDQAWAGADVANSAYQILGVYYPMPADFGYIYAIVDIRNARRLWPYATQEELALWDPQRATVGQAYAFVFRDYSGAFGGSIGPVIPISSPTAPGPVSTTSTGFSYPANATYIIQVTATGPSGFSSFQWLRAGQIAFQPPQLTSDQAITLSDGVEIYWPDGPVYNAGDLFAINCLSQVTAGVPRYELWPPPVQTNQLYPTIYIAKESDLTVSAPSLPPFIANRGEVLLEMALEKCAEFPGTSDIPNPYHDLKLAQIHAAKVSDLLVDLVRNDEEVGIHSVQYQNYPYYNGPWFDGSWQQRHAPFLNA